MKIYMVHPISGLTPDEVFNYYQTNEAILKGWGYDVLTPMYGKGLLRTEVMFKDRDYTTPCTTNHAIFTRDHWMVTCADVIYANFTSAKVASIGSIMELAWASHLGKHVIATIPEANVHRHCFVTEACSIVYPSHEESMEYLRMLSQKEY
jgi:nucleoside 2-deoxyribosyltransferase